MQPCDSAVSIRLFIFPIRQRILFAVILRYLQKGCVMLALYCTDRNTGEFVKQKQYEFEAVIHQIGENGGAYIIFPWDLREESGKGRMKVHAEFDGIGYDGSIVNMGVKDHEGNICWIIGLLKSIRRQLGKGDGDIVNVVIRERNQSADV